MRDHLREKVAIGYPFGTIEPRFHASLLSLLAFDMQFGKRLTTGPKDGLNKSIIAVQSTHVAMGRNQIVRRFLEDCTADWLVFIDTDQTFPPNLLERLIESADPTERPIVSALIMAKKANGRVVPACTVFENESTLIPRTIPASRWWVAIPGTGCVIIHRRVLEAMRDKYEHLTAFPWFAYPDLKQPDGRWDTLGEDYTFMMRALELGVVPVVDTTIEVGHIKTHELTSADFWAANPEAAAERWEAEPSVNVAVIPFKNKWKMTRALVEQLDADVVFLYNNGSDLDETQRAVAWCDTQPHVELFSAKGLGIHEMWNAGVDEALSRFPKFNAAFLNNDLLAGPNMVSILGTALRAGPDNLTAVCPNYDGRDGALMDINAATYQVDRLRGIYAGGNGDGLAGFAFMVKCELFQSGYRFPEECMWWFGDNDLTMTIDQLGGWYGMVHAATVEHLDGGSATIGAADDYANSPQGQADRAAFIKKWGLKERAS